MASMRKCIEEFCKACSYDHTQEGGWRQQVEACTLTKCPLWPVRPISIETIYAKRRANTESAAEKEEE